ncbi:MAG: hypothetical protein ACLPKB_15065 [Xanthobacteraceae bacterium]
MRTVLIGTSISLAMAASAAVAADLPVHPKAAYASARWTDDFYLDAAPLKGAAPPPLSFGPDDPAPPPQPARAGRRHVHLVRHVVGVKGHRVTSAPAAQQKAASSVSSQVAERHRRAGAATVGAGAPASSAPQDAAPASRFPQWLGI